jgi:hypothetical protein
MGLVVLVKKMSVLINFYCKIPILCWSLAKSAQILLVMSDRTDKFRELCYIIAKITEQRIFLQKHKFSRKPLRCLLVVFYFNTGDHLYTLLF